MLESAAFEVWLELAIAASANIQQIVAVKKCFTISSVVPRVW